MADLHLVNAVMRETKAFGPNPGDLRMLSYAPADLAPGAPLVVVLHGCTQSAEANARGAGWLDLADRYGFAVLAPEQKTGNNPNRCFNWFQPEDSRRGAGEAASVRQMVETATKAHRLDSRRVFVTGLSAGGGLAAALLADYPEVFAAGGIIAGIPFGAADNLQEAFAAMFQGPSRPSRQWGDLVREASSYKGPWPRVSIWQGDQDSTVKPSNADALVQQWTDVHGLPAGPARSTVSGAHRRDVWLSAEGEVQVELHTLRGMGHGAPLAARGAEGWGEAGPFLLETGVSSSLELLRFWGLAPEGRPMAAAGPRPAAPTPADLTGRLMQDVQGVIAKALGAAGLLK